MRNAIVDRWLCGRGGREWCAAMAAVIEGLSVALDHFDEGRGNK
jgi:hypothetical protein